MNILTSIEQTAISTLVDLLGHGSIFSRIVSEIERTNADLPDATGADKRHKVMVDLEIIFDDLIEPICESILRVLLELAVTYVKKAV
jgi:hypothetical protein